MSNYQFLTLDILTSSNLVPAQYKGQDVRLSYSKDNPANMGYWFSTANGHEPITLSYLVKEMGMTPEELHNLTLAYMVSE